MKSCSTVGKAWINPQRKTKQLTGQNISALLCDQKARRVDPRLRGGGIDTSPYRYIDTGRSPPARGRRKCVGKYDIESRSIPACAGEAQEQAILHDLMKVDPRLRGGGFLFACTLSIRQGRSPPARGRPLVSTWLPKIPRSIPACAGEAAYLFQAVM